MRYLFLLIIFTSTPALAQVKVEKAWARASAPGAKVAAGYMLIRNASAAPDRLVAVTSPVAGRVETHVHIREGDIVRMREVKGYDIPANGMLELEPGGAHLMLVGLKRPLKEGETVPATLKFEKAGEVKTEFHVGRLGAAGHKH
jgi:periplasmic copper chaperone A